MLDLFIQIRIVDVIDIVLVAALLYTLYRLLKGTGAISIFIGIVAIFLLWQLVKAFQMELLSSILGAFVNVGFIALIVIFQPEIRRFLFTIGTQTKNGNMRTFRLFRRKQKGISLDTDTISQACIAMSNIKQGALIVITRQNTLADIVLTGVTIDAQISKPLIENIFFKNSPLHDGAMILTDNKIVAARCHQQQRDSGTLRTAPSRCRGRHRKQRLYCACRLRRNRLHQPRQGRCHHHLATRDHGRGS